MAFMRSSRDQRHLSALLCVAVVTWILAVCGTAGTYFHKVSQFRSTFLHLLEGRTKLPEHPYPGAPTAKDWIDMALVEDNAWAEDEKDCLLAHFADHDEYRTAVLASVYWNR